MFDPLEFHSAFGFDGDALFAPGLPWSPTSPTASVSSDADLDASASTLEREMCTNFTCCGLAIADMHDLLDHFEEKHVLSQDEPSVPFALLDSNTASRRGPPLVLSFPRPLTPKPSQNNSALPSLVHSPSSASDSDASLASPSSPLFVSADFPSLPSRGLPPASFSSPSRKHSSPLATHRERGVRGRFKPRPPPPPPVVAAAAGGARLNDALTPRRRDRDRERQFRCHKPGCVKSYLNPNGLKYHLEKGTCKILAGDAPAA